MWIFNGIVNAIGSTFIGSSNYITDLFINRVKSDGGVFEAEPCLANTLNGLSQITSEDDTFPFAQYLAATGITGETQVSAIYKLMSDLKAFGLWSKMKAIYPFVTDNKNLASYTEDFSNGYWTGPLTISTDSIIAPNGTNTADALIEGNKSNTYYQSNFSSLGLSSSNYTLTVYVKKGTRDWVQLSMNNGTTNLFSWFNVNTGSVGTVQVGASASITNSGNGWYRCSMTCAMSISGNIIGFGPAISDGVSTYTGNSSIGIYAWGAQLELGSIATTYQPIATTQQAYIAAQFKYNLVNPVDSDAAFRLVFNGGWTHSSNGAQGNGVNSFANPFLSSSANLQLNSAHVSYYSRTNSAANMVMMGTQSLYVLARWTQYHGNNSVESDQGGINTGNTTAGFFMSNRTSGSAMKYQINNSIQTDSTSTAATASIQENLPIYLGCQNTAAFGVRLYNNYQTAFSTIGDGLTDTEASNLYTIVQNFQTSLNRQIP
jgi:hypothetical protein